MVMLAAFTGLMRQRRANVGIHLTQVSSTASNVAGFEQS
jgi:hypothetical protein